MSYYEHADGYGLIIKQKNFGIIIELLDSYAEPVKDGMLPGFEIDRVQEIVAAMAGEDSEPEFVVDGTAAGGDTLIINNFANHDEMHYSFRDDLHFLLQYCEPGGWFEIREDEGGYLARLLAIAEGVATYFYPTVTWPEFDAALAATSVTEEAISD